jgi:hypothetical protein
MCSSNVHREEGCIGTKGGRMQPTPGSSART